MDILRKVMKLVNDRLMPVQNDINDLKINNANLQMRTNTLAGALYAQTPRLERVVAFRVYPFFDTSSGTAVYDPTKVQVNTGQVFVSGAEYTEGNATWGDVVTPASSGFYEVTPVLTSPAAATDIQYMFVGVNHDSGEYCMIASNEAPEAYTGVPGSVANYDIVPICKFSFDGSQVFQRKDIQVKHEGDITLGASTASSCPRFRVTVDASGNVTCSTGTWMIDGAGYTWSTAQVHQINALGYTAGTGNVSAAGTYYVVGFWGNPSYPTEPIIDPSNWTFHVGVTSALSGIGLSYDRNVLEIADIVIDGSGNVTVTQHHCEDVETDAISTNEDSAAWVASGYYTWAGLAATMPTRRLLERNDVATYPETGSRQLANEQEMADSSWNLFFAQATSYAAGAEAQGPDATGHWCGVDNDYVNCTKSDKIQRTLDIRADSAHTGVPYPTYTIGLYGINDIPTGSTQIGKYAAYFKNDGAVDGGGEPRGELNYAAFDESRTGDTPTHKSIRVSGAGGYIEVFGFNDSYKWQFPWASDNSGSAKELKWGQPIQMSTGALGTAGPADGVAPTTFWTDVPMGLTVTGTPATVLNWSDTGSCTWDAPAIVFGSSGSGGSYDPVGAWLAGGSACTDLEGACGGGIWTCDDVKDCLTDGSHNLDHDIDLVVGPTPSEGSLVTAMGHHGTYWANETNPVSGVGDAQNYHTTGEVHAGKFTLHSDPTGDATNAWLLASFTATVSGAATLSGATGATLTSSAGKTTVESGGATGIWINGYANPLDIDSGAVDADTAAVAWDATGDFVLTSTGSHSFNSSGSAEFNSTSGYVAFYGATTAGLYASGGVATVDGSTGANISSTGGGVNLDAYTGAASAYIHIGSLIDATHDNEITLTSLTNLIRLTSGTSTEIDATTFIDLNPTTELQINGTAGITISNWITKGVWTGTSVVERTLSQLKSTDKVLCIVA